MYPNEYSSSDFVFVKKLVDEFEHQGHKCYVISPFNVLHYKHSVTKRYQYGERNNIVVLRRLYLSFGMIKILSLVTRLSRDYALKYAYRMMGKDGFTPDVIYCHFWRSGLEAYPYAKKQNIPLFVASGESEIDVTNTDDQLTDFCDYVKGVICVSSKKN